MSREQELQRSIKEIHISYFKLLNRKLSKAITFCDINEKQAMLLMLVEKEGMTQKMIANHLHITEATLSSNIKRLEIKELLVRTPNSQDKRKYDLNLTESGKQVVKISREISEKMKLEIWNELSEEDYELIMECIQKLKGKLEKLGE